MWACVDYPEWIHDGKVQDTDEKARLRDFFHGEIASREPALLKALDTCGKYREFEAYASTTWLHAYEVIAWINSLDCEKPFSMTDSDEDESDDAEESDGAEESDDAEENDDAE